jgi:DNA-binding response OmpR family regulator
MNERTRKVLLGEDSKVFARAHELTLRKAGYETIIAEDGMAALQAARTLGPDLIVLDLMLPKLQGQTVLRELKKHSGTSKIPVIIYSGLPASNGNRLIRAGAHSYMEKNKIDTDNFLAAVERVFAMETEAQKQKTISCHQYWAEYATIASMPATV